MEKLCASVGAFKNPRPSLQFLHHPWTRVGFEGFEGSVLRISEGLSVQGWGLARAMLAQKPLHSVSLENKEGSGCLCKVCSLRSLEEAMSGTVVSLLLFTKN